ncbi:hypothetical protein RND71_005611 [Anisodus tanguticus]|uniref:Uncharacterized protein n=1 Tax=Anisodus tanguticus TaxID=243964 RepID=A0AAE1VV48_9SOLA|nr:hypothetical protein RND71_005611 [Anisodus tanguticus]
MIFTQEEDCCCVVYDDKRRRVAEIKRKEAVRGVSFGIDVFRLIVQPGDIDLSMALVILLDQMFGSFSKRFSTPIKSGSKPRWLAP